MTAESELLKLLLPSGLTEYFELTKVEQKEGILNIYLQELNIVPQEYQQERLESKGFLPEISVQDFPIRGKKVFLHIQRRRWLVLSSGKLISRDWDLVSKGARMTQEFGLFLKKIFG